MNSPHPEVSKASLRVKECTNCSRMLPGGYIKVDNVNDPHCSDCGKAIIPPSQDDLEYCKSCMVMHYIGKHKEAQEVRGWEERFKEIRITKCPIKGGCQCCKTLKQFIQKELANQKKEIVEQVKKYMFTGGKPTREGLIKFLENL